MNIVTVLIVILLGLAVMFTAIVFQIVQLARIYQVTSWWIGAIAFILLGARQVYGLVRLPAAIMDAQLKGVMIERLTTEQWFTVVWAYAIAATFILWLDWLRRDLAKLGIGYERHDEALHVK